MRSERHIKKFGEFMFEGRVRRSDREVVFESPEWLCVAPLTHEAAMKYGADTNWCTATSEPRYWEWYGNNGSRESALVYCLDKKKRPAPREARREKIQRFSELYNTDEWDEQDYSEYLDFSRVAVAMTKESGEMEMKIWDANNFETYDFDVYGMGDIPGFTDEMASAVSEWLRDNVDDRVDESSSGSVWLYHGTGKGQVLSIVRDGGMIRKRNGESEPSVSFTAVRDYADYYAKAKGGSHPCVLRTRADGRFVLSDRIRDNKGHEYVTFGRVPAEDLEIEKDGEWIPISRYAELHESAVRGRSIFESHRPDIDAITANYLKAAVWTEQERLQEEDGEGVEDIEDDELREIMKGRDFDPDDAHKHFDEDAQLDAYEDVKSFMSKAAGLFDKGFDDWENVGVDLWLNRNRHGSGFWDKENVYGWDGQADKLADIARGMGEKHVYIGDAGKLRFA
jgi:hypothetical protein